MIIGKPIDKAYLPSLGDDGPIPTAFYAKYAVGLTLLRAFLCKFSVDKGECEGERSEGKWRALHLEKIPKHALCMISR